MLIPALVAAALAHGQQPRAPVEPEVAVIDARLGECSASFIVTDADGAPVYGATVHVRIRYGFLGIKRMDLEVGTNSDGKARVGTLPEKARPLTYDVRKGELEALVEQDLSTDCSAEYDVTLEAPSTP
jgi:hypothetical protein